MIYDAEKTAVLITVDELCAAAYGFSDLGASGGYAVCERVSAGGMDYIISGGVELEAPNGAGLYTLFAEGNKRVQNMRLGLFGALACRGLGLDKIRISITDGEKHSESVADFSDLDGMLAMTLSLIKRRAENERERVTCVMPAAKKLRFPHGSFRAGQRELISSVYSACKSGKRLFASAPTGIGKTVSVLYGAVRAWSEGGFRRIFYLTAKASTRREAYAAAGRICAAGAPLRTVVLTAKEQMCPIRAMRGGEGFVCNAESCPYMSGYMQKRSEAIGELLGAYHGYPAREILRCASAHGLCPYELSLDLSEYCDVIICDYNYAFDPQVKLQRYFAGGDGDCVFLIDEAHNLPERARDIYSACLTEDDIATLRAYTAAFPKADGALEELQGALCATAKLCEDNRFCDDEGREFGYYFNREPIEGLERAVAHAADAVEKFYHAHKDDIPVASAAAAFLRLCRKWQDASDAYDGRYRTYIEMNCGKMSAKLYCLDPAGRLDDALGAAHASVFFSATLSPSEYFSDILGGGRDHRAISLPSPFPRENLFLCAVTAVSTRYEDREKSYKRISAVIAATCSARAGNYIVYFPSYKYMDGVLDIFKKKYPHVSIAVQKRGMTRNERDEFISFFREDEGKLRVGFCVLGGSFSEGMDLPGSRLIGTVVVGVGLPGLSAERNIIRDYYETKSESGYDYAYTYPGMNGILQAAGRVIRRDTDRGVVVLVDDRYATEKYRALMPPHWEGIKFIPELRDLQAQLMEFWKK